MLSVRASRLDCGWFWPSWASLRLPPLPSMVSFPPTWQISPTNVRTTSLVDAGALCKVAWYCEVARGVVAVFWNASCLVQKGKGGGTISPSRLRRSDVFLCLQMTSEKQRRMQGFTPVLSRSQRSWSTLSSPSFAKLWAKSLYFTCW